MARIAYVDHSFHAQTASNTFLVNLLKKAGHAVDYFWDESWRGGAATELKAVLEYDVIIMFQVRCSCDVEFYRLKHPNVIHIPMLDSFGLFNGPVANYLDYWNAFHGCKVLSFSSAIHNIVTALGIYSFPVRYYPEPSPNKATFSDGLHGFFWMRHEDMVSWPTIQKLLGKSHPFSSFHLHVAPDPGSPQPTLPTAEEEKIYNITTSTWFENKNDFLKVLDRANVFFVPRFGEGIGQSFLEAMARGQCVVASNNGTMNEYILHGLNGLLYPGTSPECLDFSLAPKYGEGAWQSVNAGHSAWLHQEEQVLDFILTPASKLYEGKYQHPILLRKMGLSHELSKEKSTNNAKPDTPTDQLSSLKLSIVTICYNEKYIEDTCRSIARQTWQNFEWIVVDGGSTDGTTLQILEQYKQHMKVFISEKDNGRYDAMNKGIRCASGEYVLFLNGGDYLANERVLERIFQYRAIPRMPASAFNFNEDILYGEIIAKESGMMPWPQWALGPQKYNLEYFSRHNLPHQATFIRRDLFIKYGCYDISYKSAGDREWFMRVFLLHNVSSAYIPIPVAVYNFEGDSSTDVENISSTEADIAYKKYEKLLKVLKEEHSKVRFTYVDIPSSENNLQLFLEAFKYMPNNDDALINVLCEDIHHATLTEYLRTYEVEPSFVHFWGKATDSTIAKAFEETDVLVLFNVPEERLIEAAISSGIPIITPNRHAFSKYHEDGVTGFFFQGDDVLDLRWKMHYFLNKPNRILEMGTRMSERAKSITTVSCIQIAPRVHHSSTRPKIAWFTPLPPQKSGIANYNANLLPYLTQCFDIDLIIDYGYSVEDEYLNTSFPILSITEFESRYRSGIYDQCVYHVGNSQFHIYMLPFIERYGGTVILHEIYMDGLVNLLNSQYVGCFNFGSDSSIQEQQHTLPIDPKEFFNVRTVKFIQHLLNCSDGILVHSKHAYDMLYEMEPANYCPVVITELGTSLPKLLTECEKKQLRRNLFIEENRIVCSIFGHIQIYKGIDDIIEALCQLSLIASNMIFLFVGACAEGSEEWFETLLFKASLAGVDVRVPGYVDDGRYFDYVNASDFSLSLRTFSRGESSAALLNLLSHGIPTIVYNVGFFSEIDDNAVLKIPLSDVDALKSRIEQLAVSEELRKTTSIHARSFAERFHWPTRVDGYRNLINRSTIYKNRKKRLLGENIIGERAHWDKYYFCFVSGFGALENGFRWTVGNKAVLKVWAWDVPYNLTANFELHPFLNESILGMQNVEVFVNENRVADWKLTGPVMKEILLPKSLIEYGQNIITFLLPNATSPKDMGINDDMRKLAVAFQRIQFFKK